MRNVFSINEERRTNISTNIQIFKFKTQAQRWVLLSNSVGVQKHAQYVRVLDKFVFSHLFTDVEFPLSEE